MSKPNLAEVAIKGGAAILVSMASTANAQDIEGAYAGLSYGLGSGEVQDNEYTYSFSGNAGGVFAGYNMVQGDWLFGAELAYSKGGFEAPFEGGADYAKATNVLDIKARIGRVFGNSAVYGVVGHSSMDIEMFGGSPSDGTADGISFGLGFETGIGTNGFIGAEVLTRDLNASAAPAEYIDGGKLTTLSLRAGLRF